MINLSAPSVFSVKKAMQTYARQGGTSAIFICDDGLQSLPEEVRQERVAFYANHNIGWVARPPHDSAPEGFKRAGKFKKASKYVVRRSRSLLYYLLSKMLSLFSPHLLLQLRLLLVSSFPFSLAWSHALLRH